MLDEDFSNDNSNNCYIHLPSHHSAHEAECLLSILDANPPQALDLPLGAIISLTKSLGSAIRRLLNPFLDNTFAPVLAA